MSITMSTTMAETTMSPRRGILVRWNAISATRLGIMQMIAHKRKNKKTSPIHHINVEEIYDEPDAVYGMFLLNKFSTLVLFDTGAPHSFISRAFVVKNKIPIENRLSYKGMFSRGRVDSKCRLQRPSPGNWKTQVST
jgi:hypothetical protein